MTILIYFQINTYMYIHRSHPLHLTETLLSDDYRPCLRATLTTGTRHATVIQLLQNESPKHGLCPNEFLKKRDKRRYWV